MEGRFSDTPNWPRRKALILPLFFFAARCLDIILSQHPTLALSFCRPCLAFPFVTVFSSGSASTGHESTCPGRGAGAAAAGMPKDPRPGSLASQAASQQEHCRCRASQQLFPLSSSSATHSPSPPWLRQSFHMPGRTSGPLSPWQCAPSCSCSRWCLPRAFQGWRTPLLCRDTKKLWGQTSPSQGQEGPPGHEQCQFIIH